VSRRLIREHGGGHPLEAVLTNLAQLDLDVDCA